MRLNRYSLILCLCIQQAYAAALPSLQTPTMISGLNAMQRMSTASNPANTPTTISGSSQTTAANTQTMQVQATTAAQEQNNAATKAGRKFEKEAKQAIKKALEEPSLDNAIAGLQAVVTKAGSEQCSTSLQNSYAAATQEVFNREIAAQDDSDTNDGVSKKQSLINTAKRKKIKTRKITAKKQHKKATQQNTTKQSTHTTHKKAGGAKA